MSINLEWDAIPAGVYDAVIHEVDFRFGSTVGIVIDYRIRHTERDYHVGEWLTLDAPKNSPLYNDTAQGKGRIRQILAAYGEKLPAKPTPAEIITALTDKALRIEITHKMTNGLPVPKVAGILGKAELSTPYSVKPGDGGQDRPRAASQDSSSFMSVSPRSAGAWKCVRHQSTSCPISTWKSVTAGASFDDAKAPSQPSARAAAADGYHRLR